MFASNKIIKTLMIKKEAVPNYPEQPLYEDYLIASNFSPFLLPVRCCFVCGFCGRVRLH